MKKCIRLFVSLLTVLFFVLYIIPKVYTQTYALGDVNTDGTINVVDALCIAQWVVGIGNLNQSYADVNQDGSITIVDCLLVARCAAGIIPELPAPSRPPLEGTPMPGAGYVSFFPDTMETTIIYSPKNSSWPKIKPPVSSKIIVDSGNQKVAAYLIDIVYESSILYYDDLQGSSGITSGDDGFYAAVNAFEPGKITVSGFDENGKGPGNTLHLINVHLLPQAAGSTTVTIKIQDLFDENTHTVGTPAAGTIDVTIDRCTMGDVNDEGVVDIIDALLLARYYVGLNPTLYKYECGDVDSDGFLTIIDALMIAQYYVGLIDDFTYEL